MQGSGGVNPIKNKWVVCLWVEQVGVAVEQARLPALQGEAFALASADGTIQVVSDEAKQWGIAPGITSQAARSLYYDLVVLPYDRAAYEFAARAIWDVLAIESSIVEPVSPELSYAEFRGTQAEVTARVRHLTEILAPGIGVPVRSSLARTKFVARQAAQRDATDEAIVIPIGEEANYLTRLPIALLPNAPKLDQKARQQITRLGIKTLGDIWALPPHRLPKTLQKAGYQLLQWAQGNDSDSVKALWPPRVVSAEVRFEDAVVEQFLVENALLKLAEQIVCQLAEGNEYTRELTLRVGLEDRTWVQEIEKLSFPESLVPPIHRAFLRLLRRLHIDQPVISLEIVGSDLGSGSGVQLSLMDKAGELPHERMRRLEAVLTFLRKRYGPRTVIPAALLLKARRIHLWIHPLGHLLCEPLDQVATDEQGTPVRYWRQSRARGVSRREFGHQGRRYEVLNIHNRWRETGSKNGALIDAEVWRVETDPFGVSELRRMDTEWRITASWD